jgi:murein DD-endopeptidase MepM/ murein hydrolase activator NlpD
VQRGDVIGTVGTAGSAPLAHLHFEVRIGPYVNPGQGYADTPMNRVSPEKFVQARRGAEAAVLNPAPQKD